MSLNLSTSMTDKVNLSRQIENVNFVFKSQILINDKIKPFGNIKTIEIINEKNRKTKFQEAKKSSFIMINTHIIFLEVTS